MFRLDFRYPFSKIHGGDMVDAVSQRQLQRCCHSLRDLLLPCDLLITASYRDKPSCNDRL